MRDLVNHVVGGNQMAIVLLGGSGRDEALAAVRRDHLGDDPLGAFTRGADDLAAAFRQPGALERTCHHMAGDVPGSQLLGFRIGDLTIHGWDLARGLGADEALDADLVQMLWQTMAPMAGGIGESGYFGSGPSGQVAEDAPLQTRLLDLTGRRP